MNAGQSAGMALPAPAGTSHIGCLRDALQLAARGDWTDAVNCAAQLDAEPGTLSHAVRLAIEGTRKMVAGNYEEALRDVLPVITELECSEIADSLAWLHSAIGFALGSLGDPERGLEWTGRALVMLENTHEEQDLMKPLSDHGCLLGMLGRHTECLEALGRTLAIGERHGQVYGQAITLGNMAYECLNWSGREAETANTSARQALDYATRAQAIAQANGLARPATNAMINRALALMALGDRDQAEQLLEQALPAAGPFHHLNVEARLALAMLRRAQGRTDEARELIAQVRAMAETERLEIRLERIFNEGVAIEQAAGNVAAALEWSRAYAAFLKQHFQHRLTMLARSAEIFAEAERLRREAVALRQQSKAWEDAAQRDTLTGALNRRGLDRQATPLFATPAPLTVAALDVDHFKQVNDTFGHAVGDAVLVALTRIINSHTRNGDVLARIGGEEFVLLLPGVSRDVALASCERIRASIEAYGWERICAGLRVTSSIGVAERQGESALAALVERADSALYAAKQGGRNRVCVNSQEP